jgi:hypothetical protein
MNINLRWPTSDEVKGFGRHVVSWTAGAVAGAAGVIGFGLTLHIITPDQAHQLTADFTNLQNGIGVITNAIIALWDGVQTVGGAVAGIFGICMAAWASTSSSVKSAAARLSKQPGTTVVTTPAIANAIPSNKVVSNTENTVVPKGA